MPPRRSRSRSAPTSRTWWRAPGIGRPITDARPDAAPPAEARAVLDFWFGRSSDPAYALRRRAWFRADVAFDRAVGERCGTLHDEAAAGQLDGWPATPLGNLARLILLDQVPRNLFRGTPRAYATDTVARALARATLDAGLARALTPVQRWFVYLPFEHSEALADQRRALDLFEALTDGPDHASTLISVRRHLEIIERFGRFPHRNAILGRASTPEETAFLREPNSSF
jgi:uncharacterized protein (DUF924 family)